MKPTSIIFIILAAILVVVGVVLGTVGAVMANSADISLVSDMTDSEGNDITVTSLSGYSLTDIKIDVKNVDVNIIGQSAESKIEFKNMNSLTYDFTVNKNRLSVSTCSPFDIGTMLKFRENGNGFNGLRNYLFLGKYKNSVSEINIYITAEQQINKFVINTEGSDINVKNLVSDSEFTLGTKNGNIVFENCLIDDDLKVVADGGNFTYNQSNANSVDFDITKGNAKITVNRQYNYTLQCESGKIFINDENVGDSYDGVYPEGNQEQSEELPKVVKGKVTSGDLTVDTQK